MNHWGYDAMSYLADAGFATGFPDRHFSAKWAVPREQFATGLLTVLRDTEWVREQGANSRQVHSIDMAERLAREFAPELAQLGVLPHRRNQGSFTFALLISSLRTSGRPASAPSTCVRAGC